MIMSRGLLVEPAKKAGIKVPDDPELYPKDDYPHWHVFCIVQLGAPMPSWNAHWENAEVIGKLSPEDVRVASFESLQKAGFQFGQAGQ